MSSKKKNKIEQLPRRRKTNNSSQFDYGNFFGNTEDGAEKNTEKKSKPREERDPDYEGMKRPYIRHKRFDPIAIANDAHLPLSQYVVKYSFKNKRHVVLIKLHNLLVNDINNNISTQLEPSSSAREKPFTLGGFVESIHTALNNLIDNVQPFSNQSKSELYQAIVDRLTRSPMMGANFNPDSVAVHDENQALLRENVDDEVHFLQRPIKEEIEDELEEEFKEELEEELEEEEAGPSEPTPPLVRRRSEVSFTPDPVDSPIVDADPIKVDGINWDMEPSTSDAVLDMVQRIQELEGIQDQSSTSTTRASCSTSSVDKGNWDLGNAMEQEDMEIGSTTEQTTAMSGETFNQGSMNSSTSPKESFGSTDSCETQTNEELKIETLSSRCAAKPLLTSPLSTVSSGSPVMIAYKYGSVSPIGLGNVQEYASPSGSSGSSVGERFTPEEKSSTQSHSPAGSHCSAIENAGLVRHEKKERDVSEKSFSATPEMSEVQVNGPLQEPGNQFSIESLLHTASIRNNALEVLNRMPEESRQSIHSILAVVGAPTLQSDCIIDESRVIGMQLAGVSPPLVEIKKRVTAPPTDYSITSRPLSSPEGDTGSALQSLKPLLGNPTSLMHEDAFGELRPETFNQQWREAYQCFMQPQAARLCTQQQLSAPQYPKSSPEGRKAPAKAKEPKVPKRPYTKKSKPVPSPSPSPRTAVFTPVPQVSHQIVPPVMRHSDPHSAQNSESQVSVQMRQLLSPQSVPQEVKQLVTQALQLQQNVDNRPSLGAMHPLVQPPIQTMNPMPIQNQIIQPLNSLPFGLQNLSPETMTNLNSGMLIRNPSLFQQLNSMLLSQQQISSQLNFSPLSFGQIQPQSAFLHPTILPQLTTVDMLRAMTPALNQGPLAFNIPPSFNNN